MALQSERMGAVALAMGSKMDEHDLAELQNPATWDDESAEVLPAAVDPRVVVPVRFTPGEFALIARFARESGLPLTHFLHHVILEHVGRVETVGQRRARA